MPEIETLNKFLVSSRGGGKKVVILKYIEVGVFPLAPVELSHEDAILLAAWLVVMAAPGTTREQFLKVLDAVENT